MECRRCFKMEFSKRKVFFLLIGISGIVLIILANSVGFYTTNRVYVVSTNFHNSSLSYLASINMNISLLSKTSMIKQLYDDLNKSQINHTVTFDGHALDRSVIKEKYSRDHSLQSNSLRNTDKDITVNSSNLEEMFANFNNLDDAEQDHEPEHARDINDHNAKLSKKAEIDKNQEYHYVIRDGPDKHKRVTGPADVANMLGQDKHKGVTGPADVTNMLGQDKHKGVTGPADVTNMLGQDKHKGVTGPADVDDMVIQSKQLQAEQRILQRRRHQQQQQQQQQVLLGHNYQDNLLNMNTHGKERIRPQDFNEKSAGQEQIHRSDEFDGVLNVNNEIERNRKHDDVFRKFSDQKPDTNLDTIKNAEQPSNDVEMVVGDLKDRRSHVIDLEPKDGLTADAISEKEGESEGFLKDPNCSSRPTISEDIICLKRPKFLSDFRNPCWYERGTLRCLPYFYIFGVCKTGSTDLFERLSHHPEVIKNDGVLGKETWYWGWMRYGHSNFYRTYRELMTFDEFIDKFDAYNIRSVTKRLTNGTLYHPAVTGHGDPMDFWDHTSWPMIPQNNPYLDEPNITTPSLVKHVNPNVKLILLLRDPVERLFSNYLHGKFGETAEQFHEDVLTSLTLLSSCRETRSMKSCLYDSQIIRDLRVPISASFYSIHLQEWLKVFPRKQMFIIRTEDFSNNVANTLLRLFRFLKLDPIPTRDLYRIANMPHFYDTKAKLTAGEIQSDTREVLQTLFEPYNTDLAKMLDDEKFNFNTS